MSDDARKALVAGCVLLAVISGLNGFQRSNTLLLIAGPVAFLAAALFFWRRKGRDTPGS